MTVDFDQDLVLIIGASGRTASFILPSLAQRWKRLRLVCNSDASFATLTKDYPSAEVSKADLTEPASCRALLKGVTTVFHIGPPFHPHESEIGYNVIDAAVLESEAPGNNFQHFIYSSVLQSVFRKMLNHDRKRYVEEYLMETDLNWTIIQPGHMVDSMAPTIRHLMTSNDTDLVVTADFSAKTRFTNVVMQDLGEAIVRIIEQREKHFFAQYPLVSMDQPMSHEDMWMVVAKLLGKRIKIHQQSFDEALNGLRAMTLAQGEEMSPSVLKGFERTLLFYNRKGLLGNSNALELVLGRKTTSFEKWARDIIENKPQI
jgi:uncharacterized protein YbjT (DUF2867 family)